MGQQFNQHEDQELISLINNERLIYEDVALILNRTVGSIGSRVRRLRKMGHQIDPARTAKPYTVDYYKPSGPRVAADGATKCTDVGMGLGEAPALINSDKPTVEAYHDFMHKDEPVQSEFDFDPPSMHGVNGISNFTDNMIKASLIAASAFIATILVSSIILVIT